MKIALINGSPKAQNSASELLLDMLKEYLPGEEVKEYVSNKVELSEKTIMELLQEEVLVFAFPLYIDSIPSHLLRCLEQVERTIKETQKETGQMVYTIVNNGFFDGKQNVPAIECIKNWCSRCGFSFGQGIGIGGGGMIGEIKSIPNGYGPKRNVSRALKNLSENMQNKKSGTVMTLEFNYPAFLYKLQAEYGWRFMARKNGVKIRELNKKW